MEKKKKKEREQGRLTQPVGKVFICLNSSSQGQELLSLGENFLNYPCIGIQLQVLSQIYASE